MYSMGLSKFQELAKDAKDCYKVDLSAFLSKVLT